MLFVDCCELVDPVYFLKIKVPHYKAVRGLKILTCSSRLVRLTKFSLELLGLLYKHPSNKLSRLFNFILALIWSENSA